MLALNKHQTTHKDKTNLYFGGVIELKGLAVLIREVNGNKKGLVHHILNR